MRACLCWRGPAGAGPPGPTEGIGKRIVEAHLAGLAAKICLVTDLEQIEDVRDGAVTKRTDLLHGVVLPPPDRVWTWRLAPFSEAERDRRLTHRAQGYANWAAAGRH